MRRFKLYAIGTLGLLSLGSVIADDYLRSNDVQTSLPTGKSGKTLDLLCPRNVTDATAIGHDFKLAALRWPERVLQFYDGHCASTESL